MAQVYGLKPIVDRRTVLELAGAVAPQSFVPKSGVRIAVTEQEAGEMAQEGGRYCIDRPVGFFGKGAE